MNRVLSNKEFPENPRSVIQGREGGPQTGNHNNIVGI